MNRKIFSWIMALCMIVSIMPVPGVHQHAHADETVCEKHIVAFDDQKAKEPLNPETGEFELVIDCKNCDYTYMTTTAVADKAVAQNATCGQPELTKYSFTKVVYGSKAWWRCSKGHEWQAIVANRTRGSKCPVCVSATRVQKRISCLVSLSGSLATNLKPSDVTPSSNKIVWWQCVKGHEWQASVANRNNRASSCPYCSGRRVITGVNDLATSAPWLAAEWHRTLNGDLNPSDVKAGSNKKVWWQCSHGHEWMATINARYRGNDCPVCDKIRRANK